MGRQKDPGKHWSPSGRRPSYSRSEMPEAESAGALAICEHHRRGLRVEVEYDGEGFDGYFDPKDPEDVPLVRFRAFDYTRPEDESEIGTYCTQIPATMPLSMMRSFACELVEKLADNEEGQKRLLQEWSWTDEADVRRIHAKREKQENEKKKGKK